MTAILDELKKQGKTGPFIGGSWSHGAGELAVVDPATEDVLVDIGLAEASDAEDAVTAAYEALAPWGATPPRERGEILRRTFEAMRAREEDLAELIVLENGKAFPDALGEVRYAAEFFRWFSEEASRIGGELRLAPGGDKRIITVRQPVGVSVMITPWNFPAAMATRKIGPALAAGCTAIVKPASDTPLTTLAVVHLMEQAGLPAGVVNVVVAKGSSGVVEQMLHDPRVRKLSFTGSTEVGQTLLKVAADQVLNVSMELGGNAPFIVFEDADLEAALEGAMVAKMRNAGEACTAANRFLVHSSVVDEFTSMLAGAMGAMKVGPGIDRSTQVGPMINQRSRDDIAGMVQAAVDSGAGVAVGANVPDRRGFFYAPTVLSGVSPDSAILDQEIFGPVAPVVTFDSDDEAIAMANDTVHGLISYVYTTDLARGLRTAEAIESGMVGLNRGLVSDPAAPFGGVKQSGIGREGSHEGIEEFLETKYIATSW
ncbi:MAG TPA: NAD-dependent succinate-semialdehyde dehydrogenase [Acidimicrobiia bacterium]|nr:NAD-dependent succinate-semialdehyde dehydrogenase [Acidimicrobiia bacterium]